MKYFPTDLDIDNPLKAGVQAIVPDDTRTVNYLRLEGERGQGLEIEQLPAQEAEKLRKLEGLTEGASLDFNWFLKETADVFINTVPAIFEVPWNAVSNLYNLWAYGKTTSELKEKEEKISEEKMKALSQIEIDTYEEYRKRGFSKEKAKEKANLFKYTLAEIQNMPEQPDVIAPTIWDPNVINWVKEGVILGLGGRDRKEGERKYLELVNRMKVDINIDKEAGNSPFVKFMYGFSNMTPIASDMIRWTGEGAPYLGSDLWSFFGGMTSLMIMLIITQSRLAPGKIPQYDKFINGLSSGLHTVLPKIDNIQDASFLVRQGYKAADLMIPQGIRGASGYTIMNFMRKSTSKTISNEVWEEKDYKELFQSAQLGFGMSFLGAAFFPMEKGLKGAIQGGKYILEPDKMVVKPLELIKWRALEEASQMAYGAMIGLADIKRQKGYLEVEDVGNAWLQELLEEGPEIFAGAGMSLIGRSASLQNMANNGRYILNKTQYDLIGEIRPELKGDDIKIGKALREVKEIYSDLKKEYGENIPFAKFNKKVEAERNKVGQVKNDLEVKKEIGARNEAIQKIIDNPYLLDITHQLFLTKGDLNKLTRQDFDDAIASGMVKTGEGRGTLQDPLSDFDKVADNLWYDINKIRKHVKFSTKKEYQDVQESIKEWYVPEKKDPDMELAREVGDAEGYKEAKLKFEKKQMSDKEFKSFIKNWTKHVYGGDGIEFEHLPKEFLNDLKTEIDIMKKGGEAWEYAEKQRWIDPSDRTSIDKVVNNVFYSIRGLTDLAAEYNRAPELEQMKTASVKEHEFRIKFQEDLDKIFVKLAQNHWWRGYKVEKGITEAIHTYLGSPEGDIELTKGEAMDIVDLQKMIYENTGRMIDTEILHEVTGEYKVYLNGDKSDPLWQKYHNEWKIKDGLANFFNIPWAHWVENYFPVIFEVVNSNEVSTKVNAIKNVNAILRRYGGGEGIPVKTWDAGKYKLDKNAIDIYFSRMLKHKLYGPIVDTWKMKDAAEASKMPDNVKIIFNDFLLSVRGQPSGREMAIRETIAHHLSKLPGVNLDARDAPRVADFLLTMVYTGGLGLRFSSALKNSFQGPLNNPPGMSSAWWARGLFEIMTSKSARELLKRQGIFETFGAPTLRIDESHALSSMTKFMLSMFTWVDHYMNRGPVYLGARAQIDHYWDIEKAEGITKIANKQHKALRDYMINTAKRLEKLENTMPKRFEQDYNQLKNLYGFLQQANSNWEYGKFGRPHFLGTTGGRMAFTFLSWPAWYYGTYLPSLFKHDVRGLMEHTAKGLFLMYIMDRYFSMNLKPWLLTGPFPTEPVGPLVQMGFNAAEYVQAWNYDNDAWRAEVLDDLKRSVGLFLPGYYAFWDWMRMFRELQMDLPAFDKKTGFLKYEPNWRGALTEFFGVSTMRKELDKAGDLLRQGSFDEASELTRKWGMLPYRKKDLGDWYE